MMMSSVLQKYWLKLSVNHLNPLSNRSLILPYQRQIYQRFQVCSFQYSTFAKQREFPSTFSQRRNNDSRGEQRNEGRTYRSQDGYRSRNQDNQRSGRRFEFTQPVQEYISPTINKDLTKLLTNLQQLQPKEVTKFLQDNRISAKSDDNKKWDYIFDFQSINLPEAMRLVLKQEKYASPTAIQSVAIPSILSGNDLISIAQTGSGKTLAFVLPSILHLQNQPLIPHPRILIMAPTRELAMQIQTQYDLFRDSISSTSVYGGIPKYNQQRQLQRGCDVIIATPGRLLDFINDGLSLTTVTQVILDEADRMLDMGFEPQIRDVLKNVRTDSATWPKSVQNLARDLCQNNPNFVQVGFENDNLSLNKDITQEVTIVDGQDKIRIFSEIIERYRDTGKKILVFCSRKHDTTKVEQIVTRLGMTGASLHGDLEQRQRDDKMFQFKSGKAQVLIATNLASRGLDIQDIELVINYDFPDCIEDYVHRIGRTGRAGKSGLAISFVHTNQNYKHVLKDLVKVLKQSGQQVSNQLKQLAFIR